MNYLSLQSNGPQSIEYTHESGPQWDNGQVFNANTVFRLENYGLIKMLFIKMTVTPSAATSYPAPSSPYIIENVFLESNGVAFARVNTTYTVSRIDQLYGSGLYDKMIRACNFTGTFDSVQTVSLPLFFYVIDGQTLDVSNYDNVTIRVTTKSTRQQMGLGADPTSISLKLVTIYNQYRNNSHGDHGVINSVPVLPLKNSYNITSENFPILTGETSKIVGLNNQSKVRSLIFMIRRNADARIAGLISGVKLRYTNGTEETYDNLTNFNLSDNEGTNDGKMLRIKLNSFTKMNGNMNPVTATVYNTALADSTLFIVYEYSSVILESNRMLMETFEESLY